MIKTPFIVGLANFEFGNFANLSRKTRPLLSVFNYKITIA